jgi:hypothetical protein
MGSDVGQVKAIRARLKDSGGFPSLSLVPKIWSSPIHLTAKQPNRPIARGIMDLYNVKKIIFFFVAIGGDKNHAQTIIFCQCFISPDHISL